MDLLRWLYEASIPVAGYELHWLELVGVLFGLGSAIGGLVRRTWAWPVGIIGNVLLFFVYITVTFDQADGRAPLFGQSGRQIFFIITSIYGWWRWNEVRKLNQHGADQPAITPRWATMRERLLLVVGWLVGTVIVHQAFVALWQASPNPFFTPQWWFYWCDAWIFVGSIAATYAMARGWNEFWLAWIAVDLVGVPLGFATGYVPTAVMYTFYGLFVIYGFTQWVKVTRTERPEAEREVEPARVG